MAWRGGAPQDPIPPGWRDCPCMGEVSDLHRLIPMKVPLGNTPRNPSMVQRTGGHWCPMHVLETAHAAITAKDLHGQIGMVLDLSNSDKYYSPWEFESQSVRHCKVPCRGRGQSPSPLAVNIAVWEIRKALAANPSFYILVHCTHGYNRSGFVIICAAMRLLAEAGWCVERLFRRFAQQRPPGIYKHEYIDDLFKRHNEHRPPMAATPPLPLWKPADDENEDDDTLMQPAPHQAAHMTHSDRLGEAIPLQEARFLLNAVYDILQLQDERKQGKLSSHPPHLTIQRRAPSDAVIGSQPVSLDRENMALLERKRYFVTWKADGTRYLILLTRFGTYLIDRAGEVRRVHMRFPTLLPPPAEGKRHAHPVGPPHDLTLLDGEMVVDDICDAAGTHADQRRRLLIYDVMMVACEGVMDLPWRDRYKLIEKEVTRPRDEERGFYLQHKVPNFLYDWGLEAFSVRRKDFWPLYKARTLLERFIPGLCHESDGLIFQPYDDPYIPRTFPHLLKWKFTHMNSVDFKLHAMPGQPLELLLNCAMRRKHGPAETNHMSLRAIGLGEQPVEDFDVDPVSLHGKIIECSFDQARRVWKYMRVRPDKDNANHRSVFDKVMTSISDNITETDILAKCDDALQLPIYKEEQLWATGQHPSQLQAQQQQQERQRLMQAAQQQQQQQQQQQHPQQQQQHPQQQQQHSPPSDADHHHGNSTGDGLGFGGSFTLPDQQQYQQQHHHPHVVGEPPPALGFDDDPADGGPEVEGFGYAQEEPDDAGSDYAMRDGSGAGDEDEDPQSYQVSEQQALLG